MKNDILRLLTKREIIQIDVMKLKLASLSFSNVIKSILKPVVDKIQNWLYFDIQKNYLIFWYWKPHLLSVDRIYMSKLLISLGLQGAIKQ